MSTLAAVMTGKGIGAISSISVVGPSAEAAIEKIFRPAGGRKNSFTAGDMLVGDIIDGDEIIDNVVIACRADNVFEIDCHGNPIIVEITMNLLRQNGVELITAEQMLAKQLAEQDPAADTITIESKLEQTKAVTLEGVKIIAAQAETGLAKTAQGWLKDIENLSLEELAKQCQHILSRSRTAKLIINGCRIVIAGPPNSGKSTLLNCLAGRQKAIVADIPGTTRDWVSARCRIGPLIAEFLDTAGLDEALATDAIDTESQRRSAEFLSQCDLVLLVLDASQTLKKCPKAKVDKLIAVLNKSDLGSKINENDLNFDFDAAVTISAATGDGTDELIEKIHHVLATKDFDFTKPACFTKRQQKLLTQLQTTKSNPEAKSIITELLNGKVNV